MAKSDAQKRYFHLAEGRGKAPHPALARERMEKSADAELPEHATFSSGGEVACPHCGMTPSAPQMEADAVPQSGRTTGEDFASELLRRRGSRGVD